jgi:predicted ATP-dependent serine protease
MEYSDILTRMRDYKLDPSMTQNFLTGTLLDYLLSTPGGLPKGANYLVLGDPGSGKSTTTFDMAANIQIGYPDAKILVIEAEMNALEMAPFAYRFPKIAALPVLFVGGGIQGSAHTCQSLVNTLRRGWDVVVMDSLEKVCSIISYEEGWPSTKAMLWVLSLIKQHCCGVNVRKVPTSFLTIQQVTKNGTARGSNIIMHDASAVMYLKLSSLTNQYSDRYIYFTKNRRGFVNFPLFYDIVSGGDVTFDVERYDDECDKREIRSHAGEAIIQIRSALDDIFDVPEDQN